MTLARSAWSALGLALLLITASGASAQTEAPPAEPVTAAASQIEAQPGEPAVPADASALAPRPALTPGADLDSLSAPLLRMVLSLLAVLAVLAVCAWLARRVRSSQLNGGLIQIVSGLSLGPKEKVVLLRVGDEEVLVGMSPAGMQPLHVLQGTAAAPRFSLGMDADSVAAADTSPRTEPDVSREDAR